MISIIVPVYNEEKVLQDQCSGYRVLSEKAEIIFVDGGSSDRSRELAARYGKVLSSPKGRAVQMNVGAKTSAGDILLFLHADTMVRERALVCLEKSVTETGYIGGCLSQRIDHMAIIFRLIEGQGNVRAWFSKVFYGDQGIFVKKDVFNRLGGFSSVPIFEDVLFTKRLRREGKVGILREKIFVSPRRWEKHGIVKTALMYNWVMLLSARGYPLSKIKEAYDDLR